MIRKCANEKCQRLTEQSTFCKICQAKLNSVTPTQFGEVFGDIVEEMLDLWSD